MKKIKVIQICHASHSYFLENYNEKELRKITLIDWYAKTSIQLKKYYPKMGVECWCPEKKFKKEVQFVDSGIKFRVFPTTLSPLYALDFSMEMIRALKEEIKNNNKRGIKTIIHLHEYHNLHGLLIASLFKEQKIIGQHHGGSWPIKHIKQSRRYKLIFPIFLIGQLWENLVLKNISCFFVLSKDEKKYLEKVAPQSKIKFQTMGIDENLFKKINKNSARKKLGLGLDEKIILYMGRINYVKGIKFLLDAMKELKEIKLKIIGFGPQEKEFRDYAKTNRLDNVDFLGGVFGEKKELYLSASDCLVLPSAKEGAPVVVMEAIAKNLPVVVTDVGGVSLMIKDGREGIIIKPKSSEEIIKAVGDILKWNNKNISQYGKKYGWKTIIQETIKEYD
jgi:glycosyltransferase involved in cell wall biosynthesis